MSTYRGVAITDGADRKNRMFPFRTLVNAYHESWRRPLPMNLGHDRSKPIGFSKLTGIYIEPGKAYLTNESFIPDTQEDMKSLVSANAAIDYEKFYVEHKDEVERLRSLLGDKCSADNKVAPVGQAVAICDEGIVKRVFPEIADRLEDGLIDFRLLEPVYKGCDESTDEKDGGYKGMLVPGVFRKGNFLLFAHRFFRRSLCIANATNKEFLNQFEQLRANDALNLKIALDFDLIGLAGTENHEIELQYWWGPRFNDKLTDIPEGVTVHKNEDSERYYTNIDETQFYWYTQNRHSTFQCEEIVAGENIMWESCRQYGCRYVHSMVDRNTGFPIHLDGAIRIYTDEQMIERLDTDISHFSKETGYLKLWRIDNEFPVETWKALITDYFRDNMLIGEYFGGVDSQMEKIKAEKKDSSEAKKVNLFIPVELNSGDGIRAYFKFVDPVDSIENENDAKVLINDYIKYGSGKAKSVVEDETITFIKLLKKKGVGIEMPDAAEFAVEDMIYNFPTIACKRNETAGIVMEAMLELCNLWHSAGDNRLISFGFVINLSETEAVHVSFAGHVDDFAMLQECVADGITGDKKVVDGKKVESLDLGRMSIENWIEGFYEANNSFKRAEDKPEKFLLIHGNVVSFDRKIVSPEKIITVSQQGVASLSLTEEESKYIEDNGITCVPFFEIKKRKCRKCGKDYKECGCIKFVEPDVSEKIVDLEACGLMWTNRSAFK